MRVYLVAERHQWATVYRRPVRLPGRLTISSAAFGARTPTGRSRGVTAAFGRHGDIPPAARHFRSVSARLLLRAVPEGTERQARQEQHVFAGKRRYGLDALVLTRR